MDEDPIFSRNKSVSPLAQAGQGRREPGSQTREMEAARALTAHLVTQEHFQHPSFLLEVNSQGRVSVEFHGSHRGCWTWSGDRYEWTPASSCQGNLTAETPEEAARISLQLLGHLPHEEELESHREATNETEP